MNVKLTKRKAWELISRIHPRLNIKQEATPPDVAIFKASTGPEGLEIRCENDWFNHNGRIKLTIGNVDGGTPIIRYYHPDTLNRDYVAEQAEKEADCLKYCYEAGFDWGGLYEIFHRVSCWCCPLQSLDELRKLRTHFPDLWAKLLDMEQLTNWKSALPLRKNGWPLAFQSTEPVNLCQPFGNGLKKRVSHKLQTPKLMMLGFGMMNRRL